MDTQSFSAHCSRRGNKKRQAKDGGVPDLYVNTLRKAAELVGGEQPLALRLKVTPSHLALWLKGLAVPPGDIFLRAADIVGEHELRALAKKLETPPSDVS